MHHALESTIKILTFLPIWSPPENRTTPTNKQAFAFASMCFEKRNIFIALFFQCKGQFAKKDILGKIRCTVRVTIF